MITGIIGTGELGSVIARQLASDGETLRLSSADPESARTLAHRPVALRSPPPASQQRRFVYLDPAAHEFFTDWERAAGDIAAMLGLPWPTPDRSTGPHGSRELV